MRTRFFVATLASLLFLSGLVRAQEVLRPQQSDFIVKVVPSQTMGIVGTVFTLSAFSRDVPSQSPVAYEWHFGDGETAVGSTVTHSYGDAGLFVVSVTAATRDGQFDAEGSVSIAVVDPAAPEDLTGEPLPALLGDVDGDGGLGLPDALLIEQELADLLPLDDDDARERADINLDGVVDADDLELLSNALVRGDLAPTALKPDSGAPGVGVTIFAPELLDPEVAVSVQIDALPPIVPARAVLGRVDFVIPLDVLSPGTPTTTADTVPVALVVDGAIVHTFPFDVVEPFPLPADPKQEMLDLIGSAADARALFLGDLHGFQDFAVSEVSLTNDEIAALFAVMIEVDSQLRELENELAKRIDALPPDAAALVLSVANANGLQDELTKFQSALEARTADGGVGAAGIAALCALKTSAEVYSSANTWVGYLCNALTVAFLASVALPEPILDGPALFAAASACVKYSAITAVPETIFELLPTIGNKLSLKATPSTLMPGETADIEVRAAFANLSATCAVGKLGTGAIQKKLIKKITYKVLKNPVVFPFYQAAKLFGETTTNALVNVANDLVGSIVSGLGLTGLFKAVGDKVCAFGQFGDGTLPISPQLVAFSTVPSDASVVVNGRQASFVCPGPDPDGTGLAEYSISGTATLCLSGGPLTGTTKVACGGVGSVTITMGDNGSLLDDIFEVVVDGQSVLTSSVPVTSISTTLDLTIGVHSLVMKGLAAPDGIGTYFISVTGGTLTNGPPTSGSNLTAGTSFSWDLIVD